MDKGLKEKIIELRLSGKTYKEIAELVNCSKGTISYHCNNKDLGGDYFKIQREKITDEEIIELNKFYKNHTIEECMVEFNMSRSSVISYTENKRIYLTETEFKEKNYKKVKNHRKFLKIRAIEYLGGSCIKCGYNRCVNALEFHHEDPKIKKFGISAYIYLSWDKIKPELDKCILICANCHRELHWELNNKKHINNE